MDFDAARKLAVELIPHLAWPLVALIALVTLKKHVIELARGATALKEIMSSGGGLVSLIDRLADVKKEATEIKEMVESLSIKDRGRELEKLAEQPTSPAAENPPNLSIDEMFKELEAAWQSVKATIQTKAKAAQVESYLMGAKGVASTLDQMVEKGIITKRAAELSKAVSAQYQWFYRTTSPREEWLNRQVYSSFIEAAQEAKRALARNVG